MKIAVLLALAALTLHGADLDRDGLDDTVEEQLLQQFLPTFFVSASDCDTAPAEFVPNTPSPTVVAKNSTVHGQVFRSGELVEIHYYHLWSKDCGRRMHHDLDAESVSVLVRKEGVNWKAMYWYAAAHENTLCDMSHAIRSTSLNSGEKVWISKGKHASFFSRELCAKGCGNDDCSSDTPLRISKLVNIGEPGAPLNGALWTSSRAWPLAVKMRPDFTDSLMTRMPQGDSAELLPERDLVRGVRSTIKVAGTTYGALETANTQTTNAVSTGVGAAMSSTGRALKRAYRWVVR